jgi:LacI family transcriptional regulator
MGYDHKTQQDLRKRPATIVDVADVAGVAIGTVSRHLNGQPVRKANRDRIEQAISTLGFRRNANAVAMKTDVTHIVGFLVPALDEFHAQMLENLTRQMRRRGRAVLSFFHDLQPDSIREGLEFFARHRVDAIVVDGETALRNDLERMVDEGLVVVLYDNDLPGLSADRVFVSNRKSSARLISHLIELGHQRIATIHGDLRDTAAIERLGGYQDAMTAHGLPIDPLLVRNGRWQEIDAYEQAAELLALRQPPTAIYSANYNMTLGVIARLHEARVAIPDDMSIVSFDDVAALRLHNPAITAVGQPIPRLAETISTIIDERLAEPQAMGRRSLIIDCDILLRDSVRRLT